MRKSVLITGANRGLGLALVKKFAFELNYKVYMGSRKMENALLALKELNNPKNVIPIEIDVEFEDSIKKAYEKFKELKEDDEEFFILINNAGVGLDWKADPVFTPIKTFDIPIEMLDKMYRINVFGAILTSKYFHQSMVSGGRIVNVASANGEYWDRVADKDCLVGYAGTKSALLMTNKKIAAALKDKNIYVNAVCPGHCQTRMGGTKARRTTSEGADSIIKACFLETANPPTGKYWRRGIMIPIDVHPYKYYELKIKKTEFKQSFLEKIFSVKNSNNHKILTLLGIKCKFKRKKLKK